MSEAGIKLLLTPQVRWSYGVRLLSQADPEDAPEPEAGPSGENKADDDAANGNGAEAESSTKHESEDVEMKDATDAPNAESEDSKPSKSEDENLTELLQADQVHFNKGQNILDADEPLTDLGFQAAATIVHDHLRLYAPALPHLSC